MPTATIPDAIAPELAEPWRISVARYQHLHGVHQPWIAEISPFQLGQMSKRQRDAYAKKREAEWAASGQCKTDYRAAVVAAFDAGRFTLKDPEASEDAKQAVSWAIADRQKADADARFSAALRANVPAIEELEVGDRVFSVMGSFYGTVTKISKKSVRVKPDAPSQWMKDRGVQDWKVDVPGGVQWLHYGELKEAVEAGRPFRPARLEAA